jgi:hypothetical protein
VLSVGRAVSECCCLEGVVCCRWGRGGGGGAIAWRGLCVIAGGGCCCLEGLVCCCWGGGSDCCCLSGLWPNGRFNRYAMHALFPWLVLHTLLALYHQGAVRILGASASHRAKTKAADAVWLLCLCCCRCEVTGEGLPAAMLPYCGRSMLEGQVRDLQAQEYLYWHLTGTQVSTTCWVGGEGVGVGVACHCGRVPGGPERTGR